MRALNLLHVPLSHVARGTTRSSKQRIMVDYGSALSAGAVGPAKALARHRQRTGSRRCRMCRPRSSTGVLTRVRLDIGYGVFAPPAHPLRYYQNQPDPHDGMADEAVRRGFTSAG